MKVAYVTAYDVKNVRKVNGAGHYIAACLQRQQIELELMNLQLDPLAYLMHGALKARELLHRRVAATVYIAARSRLLTMLYSQQLSRRLRHSDAELIFCPLSPGSQPTAYLETGRPVVIWTDSTFAGVLGFYPSYSNLAAQTIRDGLANERSALARSSLAIFSSEWAAETAISYYGLEPRRVRVVPFGPYIRDLPAPTDALAQIAARPTDRCRLLFIGREWRRKGGDVALAVAEELHARGIPVELAIVGCDPPATAQLPQYVRAYGFLSQDHPRQRRQMARLYAESHFLVLPTRADCAPAVFREAGAYGLPSVTGAVGGVTTIIRNGRNGQILAQSAGASDYADYIARVWAAPEQYRQLALGAHEEYRARLNWDSAGRSVRQMLDALTGQSPSVNLAVAC